jgi:dihydroneopterin aldolase
MEEAGLRSAWEVRTRAREPFAVIRVKNLQSFIQGPHDAWGRPQKNQPLLASVELSLKQPFGESVSGDQVTSGDTVHYGLLSKAIMASLASIDQTSRSNTTFTLKGVVNRVWSQLTGMDVNGAPAIMEGSPVKPFLDASRVRYMSVTVNLPKASLLGSGVSLTASAVFRENAAQIEVYNVSLRLRDLRVPTLIGVNSNERLQKQVVVTDVVVDQFDVDEDEYSTLEKVVVEVRYFMVRYVSQLHQGPWSK